ncbi:myosin-2 heavy chain-like isoform X2 [Vespa velutina]|uniref:myosin-2 heavy chain-like isoform X2 n=1 Tax=Vespa velutina TaxID=202808 RepID=UPI001FB52249|nr:myosin-2 heavy chain-like isoform X2 [Vespa velutina]XP_047359694.1 myosin-2 heavy chain-like isoform X2 [Vespa velutina]XP_047359695.1 myosin-2 heavy chain-like isoform X2 [Vespa velutina]XP_047359696.1 myosin-2 heavy chain-like isoform X2 [Vespa velutina]
MLHSKATAALMRLKEIDKKYKMRKEEMYIMNSSTESALTSPSMEHSIREKKKLNNLKIPLKSKLDVRMPKTQIEVEEVEEEYISRSTTNDKVSSIIVIDVETKSAKNIDEEFSNNTSSSLIETNENISTRSNEKVVSNIDKNESIEIDENKEEMSEKEIKMDNEDKEIIVEVLQVDREYSTSKILSEIEEFESLPVEQALSYVNDTFEEASSTILSTMKTNDDPLSTNKSFNSEDEEEKTIDENMRFGVKKVDIISKKDFILEQQEADNSGEKQIVELVPPKLIENTSECEIGLNKELSNYVKTIESIEGDVSDITPVQLLRSSKQTEISSRSYKKKYKRRPSTTKDNNEDSSKSDKTESLVTSKSNRRSPKLTLKNDIKKINNSLDDKTILFENNEQRNTDDKGKKLSDKDKDSNIIISSNNDRFHRTNNNLRFATKRKKKRTKSHRSSRIDKTTDFNEKKFSRFDIKQMYRLQKQISKLVGELRLYDNSSSKKLDPVLFKPLDFPNIINYIRPDRNFELTKEDPYIGFDEKLATIRQWLKDQYIFYQVRSNLVQIINEKYVPMSLEDAKTATYRRKEKV